MSIMYKNENNKIKNTSKKTKVNVSYTDPLEFISYKTEVFTDSDFLVSNKDIEITIDFKNIDNSILDITKYFKDINNNLNRIITILTKLRNLCEDKKDIDIFIRSCKKRIITNNNKILKLKEEINKDIRDMVIYGNKRQHVLEKKVMNMEQFMLAQIVYNENMSKIIKDNLQNK